MSSAERYEFALHEPAMALAPIFLALGKKPQERKKLDVSTSFGNAQLRWRGPDVLGIPDQSVLLALLAIAAQQDWAACPSAASESGQQLLRGIRYDNTGEASDLAVLKASWRKIAFAAGYKSEGGQNINLVKSALRRLAETTIWEERDGKVYQSLILFFVVGDQDGVTVILNRRTTDALWGGQHVRISLSERWQLGNDVAKALHAWFSSHLRPGAGKTYRLDGLQKHVWGNDASDGGTLRSRRRTLRSALARVGALPTWSVHLDAKEVNVQRR